jgi:hypothetical protein
MLAAGELAWWSWLRRSVLVRALIPTLAPATLDRLVVAASGSVGVALMVVTLLEVLRGPRGAGMGPDGPSAVA